MRHSAAAHARPMMMALRDIPTSAIFWVNFDFLYELSDLHRESCDVRNPHEEYNLPCITKGDKPAHLSIGLPPFKHNNECLETPRNELVRFYRCPLRREFSTRIDRRWICTQRPNLVSAVLVRFHMILRFFLQTHSILSHKSYEKHRIPSRLEKFARR